MPHEHDEAAGGQVAAQPDPMMQQAKRDIDAGQVDTELRSTPGLDAAQRDRLVPQAAGAKAPSAQPGGPSADKKRGDGSHAAPTAADRPGTAGRPP